MRKTTMEEREFDIYEVKLALNNAAEILKMIPETLDHFLGCGRRGEEPDHEHHLLLLMAIKGLIPRLHQADEFLDSPLDAENRKLLKELDAETRLEAYLHQANRDLETEKPNHH